MTDKILIKRAVLEQALEALSLALSDVAWRKDSPTQPVIHRAYNATRTALEQPQPRQSLTDYVVIGVARSIGIQFSDENLEDQIDDILVFARAIEAAHGIE